MQNVPIVKTINRARLDHKPEQERLYDKMTPQRYLDEVLNPFRQIMAQVDQTRNWDALLLAGVPEELADRLLGSSA